MSTKSSRVHALRFSFGCLALALLPCAASAGLNYDLRVNGGKLAYVTGVGQTITLDLFAQVTGAPGNSGAEGFQEGFGSILSSAGGNITGSLSSTFVAPFNANGSQAGKQQTLDGDSDLDLGSNVTNDTVDYFFARAGSMQMAGTPITNGMEFKIASFTFTAQTIGSLSDFSPISINFVVPIFSRPLDIEALWQEDTIGTNSNGLNGGTQPTVGAAVMVMVPEPSAVGLLLVGSALALHRRRRARK